MFEVWLFDCSGGLVSEQYNTIASCSLLVNVINALSQFNDVHLGYDPTFGLPVDNVLVRPDGMHPYKNASVTFPTKEDHLEETFIIEHELFCHISLHGGGTQVWLVKCGNDGMQFILKDSWHEIGHLHQANWYCQIEVDHPSLPHISCHCTVTINGKDNTTKLCRKGYGMRDGNGAWLPIGTVAST
jgi:Fungal protein kinase